MTDTRPDAAGAPTPRVLTILERGPGWLLLAFVVGLAALNAGRLDEWGADGFRLYVTQAIMQTTLYDFAGVLLIVTWFLHRDARRHGLSYWWVLPTYPFMPTVGLLLYLVVRRRRLAGDASAPRPAS